MRGYAGMGQLTKMLVIAVLVLLLPNWVVAEVDDNADVAAGKAIAFDRKKGNCLGCHVMADGVLPGSVGPPLLFMKLRYPEKALLRQQIWDATARNPLTSMPPFGKHELLTEDELDKVVEFVYSL